MRFCGSGVAPVQPEPMPSSQATWLPWVGSTHDVGPGAVLETRFRDGSSDIVRWPVSGTLLACWSVGYRT